MGIIAELNAKAAEQSKPKYPGGGGAWNGSAQIGTIYRLDYDNDPKRIGNCWANGRIHGGDYVLCVSKAGDCFYNYVLLEHCVYENIPEDSYAKVSMEFGAYQIGVPIRVLTDDQFIDIMEGKKIMSKLNGPMIEIETRVGVYSIDKLDDGTYRISLEGVDKHGICSADDVISWLSSCWFNAEYLLMKDQS